MSSATPEDLVDYARSLMRRQDPTVAGLWQRASAFLGRQALELAVRDSLTRRATGAERSSARAQFLCLPEYVSTPVALEASYIWSVLTRACHQRAYELAPTSAELDEWLSRVEAVSQRLR